MTTDPIPQLKEQLRREIVAAVARYSLVVAADRLAIGMSSMSRLNSGKLERFSMEKLIRILATSGRRVELKVIDESAIVERQRMLDGAAKRCAVAHARRDGG